MTIFAAGNTQTEDTAPECFTESVLKGRFKSSDFLLEFIGSSTSSGPVAEIDCGDKCNEDAHCTGFSYKVTLHGSQCISFQKVTPTEVIAWTSTEKVANGFEQSFTNGKGHAVWDRTAAHGANCMPMTVTGFTRSTLEGRFKLSEFLLSFVGVDDPGPLTDSECGLECQSYPECTGFSYKVFIDGAQCVTFHTVTSSDIAGWNDTDKVANGFEQLFTYGEGHAVWDRVVSIKLVEPPSGFPNAIQSTHLTPSYRTLVSNARHGFNTKGKRIHTNPHHMILLFLHRPHSLEQLGCKTETEMTNERAAMTNSNPNPISNPISNPMSQQANRLRNLRVNRRHHLQRCVVSIAPTN